jgi:protein-S-isoprenylcysteine O-methyltransferase Ste14
MPSAQITLRAITAFAGLVAILAPLASLLLSSRRLLGRTTGTSPLRRWPLAGLVALGLLGTGILLWKPLPLSLPGDLEALLTWVGFCLYLPAVCLYLWGLLALGRYFGVSSSRGADLYADHRLVTDGPYRLARHPMYLAVLLAAIGALLVFRTWAMLVFTPLSWIVLRRAAQEEKLLEDEFGDEWRSYAKRVPKWSKVLNNLILKSILGLAFLVLVLALALFLPAGSLNFWQAWLFLAVWTVCVSLITAYLVKNDPRLLASRVQAGPTAETQRSQQIIQSLASLFFIGIFIVPGLDFRYGWSHVPAALSLVSDAFVVSGFFIVFLVFRENTYTSAVIEVADQQKVISTGPYSLVRHPMYAGAILLLVFSPLALGSWVALPFPIPLILTVAVRAREEEKFLAANLPGYEEYRQKVRYRLIPYIW